MTFLFSSPAQFGCPIHANDEAPPQRAFFVRWGGASSLAWVGTRMSEPARQKPVPPLDTPITIEPVEKIARADSGLFSPTAQCR